jgi:hypothetical protein
MVRVRYKDGKTSSPIHNATFVEIIDPDTNKIAVLVYRDAVGGVHVIEAGDPDAVRYSKLFGVEFCRSVDLTKQIR